jgi:hypothetical protein
MTAGVHARPHAVLNAVRPRFETQTLRRIDRANFARRRGFVRPSRARRSPFAWRFLRLPCKFHWLAPRTLNGMTALAVVYIVVTDGNGGLVAQRFVHTKHVPAWLVRHAGSGARRCDVYNEAPTRGGSIVRTLWCDGSNQWSSSADL